MLKIVFLCVFFSLTTEAARILGILHVPSNSHFVIGSTILRKLADRGHDVTIASPFPSKDKNINYKEIYLDGLNEIAEDSKNGLLNLFSNDFISIANYYSNFSNSLAIKTLENMKIQQLIKSNKQFDIILLEPFWNEAFFGLGYVFNAQIVILSTANSDFSNQYVGNIAPISFVPTVLTPFSNKMTLLQRAINTGCTILLELYKCIYIHPVQKDLYEKYFINAPNFEYIIKNVSLVLVNSNVLTEYPRPYLPNMIPIGGLNIKPPKELPNELQTYLDNATDGAIFFSLGSHLQSKVLPKHTINIILNTFSKLPQKVLWKFEDKTLQQDFPKNVKISKWFPQNDILAHPNVKLFITHGGLLSTTEAVYRGVPVIGIPVYGDQFANTALLVSKGYGQQLLLEDLTEETFTKLIQEVLNNKSYDVNIKRSSAILQDQINNPLDRAIFWIEHIIKHGSQHLRSASVDLSLAQYLLLDVLLIITTILGIFTIGIYLTIKTICCRQKKVIKNKGKSKKE